MHKNLLINVISITIFSTCVCLAFWCARTEFNAEAAGAAGEIAMELKTGSVLYENNADTKLPMASTTKIMTGLIIAEDCNLDEVITVPDEAVGAEGSSVYLKKDEQIDIRDLLYGLMLRSGNDCAAALAIYHSGSIENFAEKMNERAKLIGAENTNFTNPSGLPDDKHYTTARDLCNIARCAMQNTIFKEVVSTKNYKGNYRTFSNKNKMLQNYEGANGVKTGYTIKAGRCLVSSAERGGMDVITVVLNCPDMYERSCELLDKCFEDYKLIKIDENSVFMCDDVLCKTLDIEYFIVKSSAELDIVVEPYGKLKNVLKGDLVGELKIFDKNCLILSRKLYSI